MSKRTKIIIGIVLAVIVLAAAALIIVIIVSQSNANKPNQSLTDDVPGENSSQIEDIPFSNTLDIEPIQLENGVSLTKLASYAGMFVEDGSDEIVSGVLQATVENNGTENIQYMKFSLQADDGKTYEFELTTLLPGQKIVVLEKNKAEFRQDAKVEFNTVSDYALFTQEPSLNSDIFELKSEENAITVTNISKENISAGRVFFKNYLGETYIGGITYMLSFTDLEPGEEVRLTSSHFSTDNSRIVFVTYAEQ